MNFSKKGPYILILLLVIILIFILGVQYGKRVKIADTAISILLSITPSPKPKITELPITDYIAYTHKGCIVSFLYPSYLKVETESSKEARLSSKDKKQFIILECGSNMPNINESTSSASILVNGVRAQSIDKKMTIENKSINTKLIQINRTSLPISFIITKELEPLITTSIELK